MSTQENKATNTNVISSTLSAIGEWYDNSGIKRDLSDLGDASLRTGEAAVGATTATAAGIMETGAVGMESIKLGVNAYRSVLPKNEEETAAMWITLAAATKEYVEDMTEEQEEAEFVGPVKPE